MELMLAQPWVLPFAIITAVLPLILITRYLSHSRSFDLPILGLDKCDPQLLKARYVQEADVLLREGYEKFKDSIFQVLTPDGLRVFLPRSYAKELKHFPRHEASGMKALADRHIGNYTTIDHESDIMLGAIKIDLNRNLGKFVGDVQKEVDYCFETQFPACDEWTSVDLHEKLLRIVAQASARIFVGYPKCRDDEWLACSTKFALDAMVGGEKLKRWHPWLRPIAQYFVSEMRQIRKDHETALHLLLPELERRAQRDESYAPNDMISWMQERAIKSKDFTFDYKELANLQMLTATAAIHTTRLAILHSIFDLAARPEYITPLRDEIQEVMKDSDGILQKQHLTQLKRLDSFMKESQRHNPPSVATFQRKALIPIKLSNGFQIPSGTIVQCNTNILEEAPQAWGNPHEFDGFRFYNMRRNPEDANRFQFASPSYDSMQFGFGNDACPGRFFASNQIKIILVYILRHFDLKFDETIKERPKNLMFEVNVLADPTKMVMMRRARKIPSSRH